jgi:hypothetical protein
MDRSQLPTESDLEKLPRRAVVAFAARCARLVLPIFKAAWPDAPQKHLVAVERAVLVAELEGAGSREAGGRGADAKAAEASVAASHAAADAAAAAASYAAIESLSSDAVMRAAHAVEAAGRAARCVGGFTVMASMLADWRKLLGAAASWSDDTPVDPSFFEPIEEPLERATKTKGARQFGVQALEIVLEFPSSASDEEIEQAAAETVRTADALHRTHGGHGLVLDTLQAEQPATAEVSA